MTSVSKNLFEVMEEWDAFVQRGDVLKGKGKLWEGAVFLHLAASCFSIKSGKGGITLHSMHIFNSLLLKFTLFPQKAISFPPIFIMWFFYLPGVHLSLLPRCGDASRVLWPFPARVLLAA